MRDKLHLVRFADWPGNDEGCLAITLVVSYGADRAEHAMLIVDESDKHGFAKVSLLHHYERAA